VCITEFEFQIELFGRVREPFVQLHLQCLTRIGICVQHGRGQIGGQQQQKGQCNYLLENMEFAYFVCFLIVRWEIYAEQDEWLQKGGILVTESIE
jgi:hypothetical protein